MKTKLILNPTFAQLLPDTYSLLQGANLQFHLAVFQAVLHGSRGLAGGARRDSDIDLSLLVMPPKQTNQNELALLLNEVFETTFIAWASPVKLDLAIIYETRSCALSCFMQTTWQEGLCTIDGADCFGLYKLQNGSTRFVTNAGVQVKLMYPCLQIWKRMS